MQMKEADFKTTFLYLKAVDFRKKFFVGKNAVKQFDNGWYMPADMCMGSVSCLIKQKYEK